LTQAPVPAHVIDKGMPTASLLAQVLVNKYADHLPLHRQEAIFARSGYRLSASTLGAWVGRCGVALQPLADALHDILRNEPVLHADETPVTMLIPGKGGTQKAYLWAYASTRHAAIQAVVYDFAEGRAGKHAQLFLNDWRGALVCDDYGGYKALFQKQGVTEAGCMAHARRKFFDLHKANKSLIAEQALAQFAALYAIEAPLQKESAVVRLNVRQTQAKPLLDKLHEWLLAHKAKVPDGSGTMRAINYSLKCWTALTRYLDDPLVPIDNNWVENQMRPVALGRKNWLFAGSLRAGKRGAAIMSLIQSAKLNGHDPYAYLKDVMDRLPTQPYSKIEELLPHCWEPAKV
jgi:transposase